MQKSTGVLIRKHIHTASFRTDSPKTKAYMLTSVPSSYAGEKRKVRQMPKNARNTAKRFP